MLVFRSWTIIVRKWWTKNKQSSCNVLCIVAIAIAKALCTVYVWYYFIENANETSMSQNVCKDEQKETTQNEKEAEKKTFYNFVMQWGRYVFKREEKWKKLEQIYNKITHRKRKECRWERYNGMH